MTLPLGQGISFEQGAALPVNYLTAAYMLLDRGGIRPGDSVLVHGAGGGVGVAAIQVARALGAGRILAVASSAEKRRLAEDAGADDVLEIEGFRGAVHDVTGGRGVDLVVDPVGGDRFDDSVRCLADEGRLLVVGFAAGGIPTAQTNRLLLRNLAVVGVHLGRKLMLDPGAALRWWERLLPHIEAGRLVAPVAQSFALDDVRVALHRLADRAVAGKLVVRLRP
ncbi:zinc-binding dehydrogenase [Georgenia sp. SYP-B2076]|uniref:zinc-binding dehydrogenase n=1 Tax=Georgenia sp. SYP-B2076 TaxID=2495881 RepID=UPI001F0B848F|nr:zinc-binding dehydrogenase [Georgenia sp. SYP-B2076]